MSKLELVTTWEDDEGVVHLVGSVHPHYDEPLNNENDHFDGYLLWTDCRTRPWLMTEYERENNIKTGSRRPNCLGCLGA